MLVRLLKWKDGLKLIGKLSGRLGVRRGFEEMRRRWIRLRGVELMRESVNGVLARRLGVFVGRLVELRRRGFRRRGVVMLKEVVDVGRNNGPTAGHFIAHKFWSDQLGNAGPKAKTRVLLVEVGLLQLALVFPNGNVFHFGGDDAAAGIVHLADIAASFGPHRIAQIGKQFYATKILLLLVLGVGRRDLW